MSNNTIQLIEGFRLDLARGCLMHAGEEVHLRPQTYEVLKYLVERRACLVSKDKLIEDVWQGRAVTDSSLVKCIEELREALGDNASKYIRNVRGRGYIFDSEADAGEEIATSEQVDVLKVVVVDEENDRGAYLAEGIRKHKFLYALALSAVLVAVGVLAYWFIAGRPSNATQITSVAVLPFVNESGDPDTEYLSDGISETLINSLSQLPGLKVIARSSSFTYKGNAVDPAKVASALGVQGIVTGRILERGDNLVISVELMNAGDKTQVWGEQYHRKVTDLVALQNEITRDVSQKLKSRLLPADEQKLAKNYTANAEAYQLYLRGRFHINKATRSEIQEGIACFQQAIAIDPSYALAYVGLASANRLLAFPGEMPATEFMMKEKAAAQKAIEIDDALAEAHSELGKIFQFEWNWTEAEKQFKRALELDPKSADAHQAYASFFSSMGQHAEALAEMKAARELDPLNVGRSTGEAQFLIYAGQPDEALARLQRAFEINPNHWPAHMQAANAYILKGLFAEAAVEARKARETPGITATLPIAILSYALAKSGKQADARAELEGLLKVSKRGYVPPYHIALMYNGLDDQDETLAWLERGYLQRDPKMVSLKVEPKFNNLRSNPRFRDLLRRIGFPP